MDMVLPRTALESTSDSVCLPGEAAVKNKSLTIKNEHRKDKSEEKATSDMTFPLSVFSGFECTYIKQEDLEKAESEININEEPLVNMEVVSNETDPLLFRYSKAAATNQSQDVSPVTWYEVQDVTACKMETTRGRSVEDGSSPEGLKGESCVRASNEMDGHNGAANFSLQEVDILNFLEDNDSEFLEVQSGGGDSDGNPVEGEGNENEAHLRDSWAKHLRIDNSVWKWENVCNTPKNITLSAASRVSERIQRQFERNPSEIDVLEKFLTEEFWVHIARETNIHAELSLHDIKPGTENKWFPVTTDELKAHFALCVLMSQVKKPSLQDYWTKRKILETPVFRETMPFSRFRDINRYLHFASDTEIDKIDKLRKVKPIIKFLQEKYRNIYVPGQNIAISESIMKFREIQHNSSRRACGLKIYKLCETSTGYCWNFKVYQGKEVDMESEVNEVSKTWDGEITVLKLCEKLLNEGRTIYMDIWYSSPALFKYLLDRDTRAVGTVWARRKCMPAIWKDIKLERGELTFASSNGILAVKWRHRKDVHMLSTKHERPDMEETRGQDGGVMLKPNCVVEYISVMAGVYAHDQQLASFPVVRRYCQGYKKLYFYLLDMTMLNASIIHRALNPRRKRERYTSFRVNIAEEILLKIKLPDYPTRGCLSQGDKPLRLQSMQWAHFPSKIPPTNRKAAPSRRCKVCSTRGVRKETCYECEQCKIALHVEDCFKIYHTSVLL